MKFKVVLSQHGDLGRWKYSGVGVKKQINDNSKNRLGREVPAEGFQLCGRYEPGELEWDRSFGKLLLYLRNGRPWCSGD